MLKNNATSICQLTFICSKSTIETEEGVKYVQS